MRPIRHDNLILIPTYLPYTVTEGTWVLDNLVAQTKYKYFTIQGEHTYYYDSHDEVNLVRLITAGTLVTKRGDGTVVQTTSIPPRVYALYEWSEL